jgi:hypothetical protein
LSQTKEFFIIFWQQFYICKDKELIMEHFDFGVRLSIYLSGAALFLCIAYGLFRWNKDGKEEPNAAKKWEKEEQKINEEL